MPINSGWCVCVTGAHPKPTERGWLNNEWKIERERAEKKMKQENRRLHKEITILNGFCALHPVPHSFEIRSHSQCIFYNLHVWSKMKMPFRFRRRSTEWFFHVHGISPTFISFCSLCCGLLLLLLLLSFWWRFLCFMANIVCGNEQISYWNCPGISNQKNIDQIERLAYANWKCGAYWLAVHE